MSSSSAQSELSSSPSSSLSKQPSSISSQGSNSPAATLMQPNPISFEAFRHAVLTQPSEQLNIYYDSEGEEVDLEETYAGSDTSFESDTSEDESTTPDDDEPADTNHSKRNRMHSPSLSRLLTETTQMLDDLSMQGRVMLDDLAQSTQIILTSQTAEIFEKYKSHGNEARLADDIFQFLTAGDEVEAKVNSSERDEHGHSVVKKGDKAKMSFDPVVVRADGYTYGSNRHSRTSNRKRKIHREDEECLQEGNLAKKGKRANLTKRPLPLPLSRHGLDHNLDQLNLNNPPLQSPVTQLNGNVQQLSLTSPLSTTNTTASTPSITTKSDYHIPNQITNRVLSRLPFHPVGLRIQVPKRQDGTVQTPPAGMLDSINRIFHIYNQEGQFLLNYFTRKYSDIGTTAVHVAPHALFRLAISQHLQAQVTHILDPPSGTTHNLTPEARMLFKECSIFGDSGSGNGSNSTARKAKWNAVERELMSRVADVRPEVVDTWWEDMMKKTQAWSALRVWCLRRDQERVDMWKRTGRW